MYRHFLRPGQVQVRFGPPAAAISALRGWLRNSGLRAGPLNADGLLLPAAGSVVAIEKAFGTRIERVRLPGGRIAHVNTRSARVPRGQRAWVIGVLGLDNIAQARPSLTDRDEARRDASGPGRARREAHQVAAAGSGIPRACHAARTTPRTFTADQLARAYGFSSLYRSGHLGRGVTVGLLELADYARSDIATYNRCYGIHPVIRRIKVDGGTTVAKSGGAVEEITADIETLAGMAPRARILVYESPGNSLLAILDNYGTILQQDRAEVVSSSYGFCEQYPIALGQTDYLLAEAGIFSAMAVQGQSMLAASGDAGSEQCLAAMNQFGSRAYGLAVGDPASQPYVTGVGGTAIVKYGMPPTETAWNQTGPRMNGTGFPAPFDGQDGRPAGYPGNMAGNGGISTFWRMPRWQHGFDTSGNSSGIPCGATRGGLCREVPDVSALAAGRANATPGYAIYGTAGPFRGKGWTSLGGTSLASPLWAALIALTDQQVAGHRLGLLSPALYQIARTDPAAFSDVTSGSNNYLARSGHPNNDTCRYNGRPGQPCYQATRGYDMATGLGSPRAARLSLDLKGA
jgi:subtilase family serine protease